MKKSIITVVVAAAALLTLTASNATAGSQFLLSGRGVLVQHDDGYIVNGTLRDADSQVVGTIHGTLTALTTGFNTCPILVPIGCGATGEGQCNILGGDVTLNFRGTIYDAFLGVDFPIGHFQSSVCQEPPVASPPTNRLFLFMSSTSHVTPGDFPELFTLIADVQPINDTLFQWSSG